MPEAMDTDPPAAAPAAAEDAAPPADPAIAVRADLKAALGLIERYTVTRESRFAASALRLLNSLRKVGKDSPGLSKGILTAAITQSFSTSPLRAPLLGYLSAVSATASEEPVAEESERKKLLPEVEVFLSILVLLLLIDTKAVEPAVTCSLTILDRLSSWNRRTLDVFAERVYFYASWAHELAGMLDRLRSLLLAAQRTACLHHNVPCQATLLNLLLRNYQHYKLFDQADKLLAKSTFPEQANNCQLARFLYYTGRIKALQLDYTEAHRCLLQAQRKAPSSTALGFKLASHKLGAIVQLLLGEIPDRSIFRAQSSRTPMKPYLRLVQAVRLGDLAAFRSAMEDHAPTFTADGNMTLVVRLRQNVIRAGLRNISLSYSRILLPDAALKLKLDHAEDMESMAAKAIRDGVIDATIDHASGVLFSKEGSDIYATLEPQAAFHKRITFTLNLHNDAVKAMSYPPDAHKGELPDADTIKERQREEQELAQSLAEEDEADF